MRILIVTQYFWPEKFRINDLSLGLKDRGHEVHVFTGKPNYGKPGFYEGYGFLTKNSEIWNNIPVKRVPIFPRRSASSLNLILNYLSFLILGTIKALFIKGQYDKILVFAPSPITSTIPAIILKWRKRADLFLWVQDLWPESVTATTSIKNRHIISILGSLTRLIYKNCDKILVQSKAFVPSVIKYGGVAEKILYYPNSVEAFYRETKCEDYFMSRLPKGFRVMFAGNIGEAQDFETLLSAAQKTKILNPEIKWLILGNGRKKKMVENEIQKRQLEDIFFLLGEYPTEDMPFFFACADCLLLSLKKKYIFSLTIPSKLQSYLACAKPIIGSLDGEGARIIEEANAGFASHAEDVDGLVNNIEKMYKISKEDKLQFGRNSRGYFEKEFEREALIDKLLKILNSNP